MPNGKIEAEGEKYTVLFRRGVDGKWLLTNAMWNTDILTLK